MPQMPARGALVESNLRDEFRFEPMQLLHLFFVHRVRAFFSGRFTKGMVSVRRHSMALPLYFSGPGGTQREKPTVSTVG